MSEVADKWAKTGLLEELTVPQKENCAQLLENCANELLARNGLPEGFSGCLIPMARKLFVSEATIPTPKLLIEDFLQFYNKNIEIFNSIAQHFKKVDAERDLIDAYIWRKENITT